LEMTRGLAASGLPAVAVEGRESGTWGRRAQGHFVHSMRKHGALTWIAQTTRRTDKSDLKLNKNT
jgi:hypothetical protein